MLCSLASAAFVHTLCFLYSADLACPAHRPQSSEDLGSAIVRKFCFLRRPLGLLTLILNSSYSSHILESSFRLTLLSSFLLRSPQPAPPYSPRPLPHSLPPKLPKHQRAPTPPEALESNTPHCSHSIPYYFLFSSSFVFYDIPSFSFFLFSSFLKASVVFPYWLKYRNNVASLVYSPYSISKNSKYCSW